jgi:hypothetical protein
MECYIMGYLYIYVYIEITNNIGDVGLSENEEYPKSPRSWGNMMIAQQV